MDDRSHGASRSRLFIRLGAPAQGTESAHFCSSGPLLSQSAQPVGELIRHRARRCNRIHTHNAARLRTAAFVLFALVCALALLPTRAFAASNKVVRVAYPISEGYETGGEGEPKEGWGYEYLQELSYHTGWTYEYVYGDFGELVDKLAAGEVDLMGNLSYTDERAESIAYSANPQGSEKYYICGRADDEVLATADPKTLMGKKVGVVAGVYQATLAQEWIDDEAPGAELVEFGTNRELIDALERGTVDAVVNTDTSSLATSIPIYYIGSSDYYLAVAQGKTKLLSELNKAMAQITATNPHYNEEVRSGTASAGAVSLSLTAAEQKWVSAHKGAVTIGYLQRALPYSALGEEDLMDGALTAFTSELESTFGVSVETRPYATSTALIDAVKSGEVDAAAPLSGDSWILEQDGLAQTESLVTAGVSLLTLSTEGDYMGTVGYSKMDPFASKSLERIFTSGTLKTYKSTVDAIEALRQGKVSSLAIPSASLDTVKDRYGLDSATSIVLPQTFELSVVLKKGRPELLDILDKAIGNARSNVAAATLSHYSYSDVEGTPLSRFFERNAVPLLIFFVLVLLAAVACLTHALRRARTAETRALLASKAKTNFLNRMSHDIRTPLNGIIGLLEVSDLHADDTKILAQNRAKEQIAANHLLELLNDVLEMGRLEDADIELENVPFNMIDVFEDALVITRLRAEEMGVTVSWSEDDRPPYPHVVGSATSLRRILLNLLSNAVKYNKPGGEIRCSLKALRVNEGVVTYRIGVADTGIGMSAEFLEHIFEPFSQEKMDARSTYQGSGMGMPIVRALVSKMGGSIEVASAVGEGSTFTVELPFAIDEDADAAKEEAQVAQAKPSIEGMHIMLVEDNELNREIADELLEMNGASVECAENGREAVELFRRKPEGTYDVILMDVMMPVMNGYEAARTIRLMDKRDAASVPIVALTANAFLEDIRAAHDAGMNDHISKPINIDVVVQTLGKYRK